MDIRCWGSRGSIPVSGKEYVKYGGDTTCMEIRARSGEIIIVDAGTGIRRLGNHLMEEKRRHFHFIFTHAHWDHVMGFPFFKPLFDENTVFEMHRCPFHSKFVETVLDKVMSAPYFPVKFGELRAKINFEDACPWTFTIGSISITPISISHPNGGAGYCFEEDGKRFVFLTDNELDFPHPGGLTPKEYADFSRGADLLIHDAEYTLEDYKLTRGWGHSTFTDATKLAIDAGVKRLGLFHLNQDRKDKEMDDLVDRCRGLISEAGTDMECFAVGCDFSITL